MRVSWAGWRPRLWHIVLDACGRAIRRGQAPAEPPQATGAAELSWNSRPMGALLDVADKEALYRALDERR